MNGRITRRRFMGSSVAIAGAASGLIPVAARAADGSSVVLVHRAYLASLRTEAGEAASQTIVLEADLVRQWRAGLGEVIARAGSAQAYVPWAESFVLGGLVREHGGTTVSTHVGPLHHLTINLPFDPAFQGSTL